jgi:hypothetical protein
MKKGMICFAFGLLTLTLAMPARGAEKSTPIQGPTIQRVPVPAQVSSTVTKPDLVISMSSLGSVYDLGYNDGLWLWKEGMNVTFTITNKGGAATGRAGSTFSVGIAHTPACQPPVCDCGYDLACGIGCVAIRENATKSFHFLNSNLTTISPPLEAGETRTLMGVLVLPECLQFSPAGGTALVSLTVDDKKQVDESNENNNQSAAIRVSSKYSDYIVTPGVLRKKREKAPK